MSAELIAIIVVGVVLAGLVLVALRENTRVLRAEIKNVRTEVKDLREDMNKQFEVLRAEIQGRAGRHEQAVRIGACRD